MTVLNVLNCILWGIKTVYKSLKFNLVNNVETLHMQVFMAFKKKKTYFGEIEASKLSTVSTNVLSNMAEISVHSF